MIAASPATPDHDSRQLEAIFTDCFFARYNTRLCGGFPEPLYQPSDAATCPAVIQYRDDYFASALHEASHWCIAGAQRRGKVDYGYWYAPDGRSSQQQNAFEDAEYKPQALEWFFSRACGFTFEVSVDNIEAWQGKVPDTSAFKSRILAQALDWQCAGLPERGHIFFRALCREYGHSDCLESLIFDLEELRR